MPDVATLIADARKALAEYQSKAWHKTVVTRPEDEAAVTAALDDIEGLRIISSEYVQPGQVIIANDDAMDAALQRVHMNFYGPTDFDLDLRLGRRMEAGSSKIINTGS